MERITDKEKIKGLQAEIRKLTDNECRDLLMMVSGYMSNAEHNPDFWTGIETLLEVINREE